MTTDNSPPPPDASAPDALDSLTRDDVLENLTLEDVRPSPAPAAAMPQGQGAGDSATSTVHGLHQSLAVPGTSTLGTAMESAAIGAAKAVIETKDLLSGGEPDQSNKWQVRRWIEERGNQLRKEGVLNGIAQSVAQFGVGFIGLGKIAPVAKGLEAAAKAGKAARFGAETTRAAVAGATVMDPHDERLSNLVEQYPALRNPVTAYLAAKPDDSEAEGRLKNALEGIVMDTVLAGGLTAATKAYRFARAGNHEASNVAAAEADDAFTRAIHGEQPTPPPDASLDPAITDTAAKVREMNLQPSGPGDERRAWPDGKHSDLAR